MKVCFLNHDLRENTGAGRFGLQLIANLGKEYHDFHPVVLTMEGCSNPMEKQVLHHSIPRLIFSLPKIRSVLRDSDIIHALDGFPYGVIAAVASIGLSRKLIITAVGTGAVQVLRSPVKGLLLRWAYRKADKLIAVSHYTKREILKFMPGLSIDVINHGIDVDEFSGSSDSELSEKEKDEIEKLKPYILSVGGGKRRKGYEYSFPAFAEIEKRFPGMRYVVVGHDLQNTPARSLGIEEKASCFVGISWPFLRALYRNAELFMLLPYDDKGDVEGFGFVFLEAAANGLPVVGTYGSGAEDAVDDQNNGFLVEPRNYKDAAGAAIKILSDQQLKERFKRGSTEFAKKMSWEKAAAAYTEIYEELRKSR